MKALSIFIIVASTMSIAGLASAVQVRGRIDIENFEGRLNANRPMKGVGVQFCGGPEFEHCVDAETGYDGIYYIEVPPGDYRIEINGEPRALVTVPPIPQYDLKPIPLR